MPENPRSNLVSTGGTEGLTTFEMLEVLETLLRSDFKQSLFLWGPTGIGKSTVVRQALCKLAGLPFASAGQSGSIYAFETYGEYGLIDLRVSLLDPSDLRGLPFPQKNLAKWFPPEELPLKGQETRFPEKGILLLDELTHAAPAVQSACYSLVLDRRVGPHEILPGWRVVAASNLATENAHTFELPHPLKNRFLHYLLRADLESYKRWGYEMQVDPRILAFLTWYPTYLHLDNDETSNAFPTPRSWFYASEVLKLFKNGHRVHNLAACIGNGAAGLFHGFLETCNDERHAFLAQMDSILEGKTKMAPLKADQAGLAHAASARVMGMVQAQPAKWMAHAVAFFLSPAWANLREIARSSISDLKTINAKAYAKALADNQGELNTLFHTVFRGFAAA